MTTQTVAPAAIRPIKNRIEALDVLRGFALLGIFISITNSYTSALPYGNAANAFATTVDHLIQQLQSLFISKRFIGIFSLLFGVGIAIQQSRFEREKVAFAPYFIRRMLALAVFGLVITTFFFPGEILLVYAIFGIMTLALSRLPPRGLLAIAAISFLAWGQYFEFAARDRLMAALRWYPEQYPLERMIETYTRGDLAEIIRLRWIEYIAKYTDNASHLGMSLAMILSGYALGKQGLHESFLTSLATHRKTAFLALAYSIAFALFALLVGQTDFMLMWDPISYPFYVAFLLSTLYCYIYFTCSLCNTVGTGNWLIRRLADNGKLALSGYTGTALIYALFFYWPGLARYMQHNASELALLAIAAYLGFTLFSWLWLSRFRMGPMEYLLRKCSYG